MYNIDLSQVCLRTNPSQDRSFYICNPSTGAFEEFSDPEGPPSPVELDMLYSSCYVAGFGHDIENNDYKVVMVNPLGKTCLSIA